MSKAVIFDFGAVLIDWNPKYLYAKLLPNETEIDAYLDEIGFHEWNRALDAGGLWGPGIEDLVSRFPHRKALIEASHLRWHEMLPGAIDESISSIANWSIVRARSEARRIASAALSSPERSICANISCRWSASIAGGISSASSSGSSAPPMRSPISWSPIVIRRGSTRPPMLGRRNASVTVRTARLFGSKMRP